MKERGNGGKTNIGPVIMEATALEPKPQKRKYKNIWGCLSYGEQTLLEVGALCRCKQLQSSQVTPLIVSSLHSSWPTTCSSQIVVPVTDLLFAALHQDKAQNTYQLWLHIWVSYPRTGILSILCRFLKEKKYELM